MPCYHPLIAYRSREKTSTGKRSIVFKPELGFSDLPIELPCGQCYGCRLERSRQWAIRCMHEAKMHDQNSFITLTYREEQLPENATLVLEHLQKFIKRLRKSCSPDKLRFFACGEYGKHGRPHYHALIFGHNFPDRYYFRTSKGSKLYRSNQLEKLWPLGFSTIGALTFESAAYTARYVMKKITGQDAAAHYGLRKPEFVCMSRRPGIGLSWLEKYGADCYPSDEVVIRGTMLCKPPKYYDDKYDVDVIEQVKAERQKKAQKRGKTPTARLAAGEIIKKKQLSRCERVLS